MASSTSQDYFRSPRIIALLLVPLGMLHISMATLRPQLIRQLPLGDLGKFTMYLIHQHPPVIPCIFYGAWTIHVIESLCVFYLAWKLDLSAWCCTKWTVQTFIYGYFSLRLLYSFKSRKKTR
ncbi:hypothetical protein LSAT2_010049 [Lamellibrachia satsuma]|nr:hypothetical protein LSAT2_010049 [Lamellibrachia satsuma]